MKNKTSLIFDFDGVIADSLTIAFEINKLSKPTLTLDRYQAVFNGNINEAKYEDTVVRKINFFKEYGERFSDLGIDQEKKNIIYKLAQEFPLYIISSTTGNIIREYLTRHHLLDCFTDILGNEIDTSKVRKFTILFNQYHINPQEVIFITDSSGDMREAQEVDIQWIVGILGGYQNKASLEQGKPDVIVENFSQFYDFVQSKT